MVVFLLHYEVYENAIKATVLRELIVYVYQALAVGTI